MSQRKYLTGLMAATLLAVALVGAGCKKEEKAQEAAPAPAQQAAAPAPSASDVVSNDFESGTAGWNQSATGISIKAANDQKHGGNASLRLNGTAGSGVWNFAASPQFNLEPGKQYQLTGWVYVQKWDKTATPPLLKCGINQNGKWTNMFTNKYNLKKMNEWQMVSKKFTAPADGATSAVVSLEKGTQDPITATVYLDDVKIERVQ